MDHLPDNLGGLELVVVSCAARLLFAREIEACARRIAREFLDP